VNSRLESSGAEATAAATTTTVPARLDNLKWILVGGFASIFVLGFIYLLRRPQVMAPTNGDSPAVAAVQANRTYSRASKAAPVAAGTVAEVTRAVKGSLDELKTASSVWSCAARPGPLPRTITSASGGKWKKCCVI